MQNKTEDEERAERAREAEERRKRALAREIEEDFAARQQARKQLERGWQINMNFLSGNQFCDISPLGELREEDPAFFWQSRRSFNHIAPTVDTRLSRLSKVRPKLAVRAFSDAESDVKTARISSNILKAVSARLDLDKIVSRATLWSEVCGTSFYKIVWNFDDGKIIGTDERGHSLKEGDVNVVALSPFEVYPDSLSAESLEEVSSLIHAKALPVAKIKEKYGVELPGRRIDSFAFAPYSSASGWKLPAEGGARPVFEQSEIVIERYTRPCGEYPKGRLEIAAGGVLLFEGDLPYRNGDRGERIFPFVRQTCIELPGAFFGTSVVDRMIPLQRAYNAVRNRKHEFLNRLIGGVIAVEDGSVDAEALAEEGLSPGKVIVYRQGAAEPHFLDCGSLPAEFEKEEERLSSEFILFSGMSEISRNSASPSNVTSATGLQLLLEQDQSRMQMSAESVERAVRETGKQILHLYKQFAASRRLLRMTGTGGKTELFYFDSSDISAEDVQFETGSERTPQQFKEDILQLYSLGLLKDKDGNLSDDLRNRLLEALGYGSFDSARDISGLHIKKAERENLILAERDAEADEYDDHELHIAEHTRALLSGAEENGAVKERISRHIASHRQFIERREK